MSEPGDRTDAGFTLNLLYDSDKGSIVGASAYGALAGAPDTIYFTTDHALSGPADTYAHLELNTRMLNTPIEVGIYDDAERAPFASKGHPGLDFGFQHGGANKLTGSFNITELTFDASNQVIQTFEGTFVQYSESRTAAMRGHVRYDLNPVIVPEPKAISSLASFGPPHAGRPPSYEAARDRLR